MRPRILVAMASALALGAGALALLFSNERPSTPGAPTAGTAADRARVRPSRAAHRGAAREDCSTRSEANFPGAFTSPRNLVVGPLVLLGGAYTDASTVREFGGNKFPLLVAAGHTVTLRLVQPARRTAGLAYGPLPQGETKLSDTYRSVTFVACRPGTASGQYSPDGPSGSYADGTSVTFWSGFVLTREPACIPLEVYVDDAPSPRRAGLGLGRRCVSRPG